jgi:hypothetical protein
MATKSGNFYKTSVFKRFVYVTYDFFSVLVILISLDKIVKYKSIKVLKPWQVARLIERIPKLIKGLKHLVHR